MAIRNGVDIIESTVDVERSRGGLYRVVSRTAILEYDHCSREFAEWLASELQDKGLTYPRPVEEVLPKLIPDEDYRREHDGGDSFLSQSTRMSLCLFCGEWYGWDEVHGQIVGGCYPPHAYKDGLVR